MTLHAPYDTDNIFAKMLRDEIPAIKVYETDEILAFMDIFPQSDGHTLIIPKHVRARNLLDMPTDKLDTFFKAVQKVVRAVETALTPDGIIVTQFNGGAAGQTVFHLHMHVIPIYEGRPRNLGHGTGQSADMEALSKLASRISAEI